MKRALVVAVVAVVASAFGVADARAEVVTNVSIPIDFVTAVDCANGGAGELVHLSGSLQLVATTTVDASGGVHLTTHANPQGVAGVGLTTGTTYQGTGVTRETLNLTAGLQLVFVNNFRLIATGGEPSFEVHQTLVFVVDANGSVSATVANSRVTCG